MSFMRLFENNISTQSTAIPLTTQTDNLDQELVHQFIRRHKVPKTPNKRTHVFTVVKPLHEAVNGQQFQQ